jgi:hypothetical protein
MPNGDAEQRQNPLIHEGAPPDPLYDGNERAENRVTILQPSGEPITRDSEKTSRRQSGFRSPQ